MGGRGASSPGTTWLPPDVLETLPYNVTSFDDELGGATFPFLEQTKRAWRILTKPVDEISKPHEELAVSRPGIGQSSIARHTIGALREIDLLDDIIATGEELIVYPAEMKVQCQDRGTSVSGSEPT